MTACERPRAYLYTMGREPVRDAFASPCSGAVVKVVLLWSVSREHSATFELCAAHREYFLHEGRATTLGMSALPFPQ